MSQETKASFLAWQLLRRFFCATLSCGILTGLPLSSWNNWLQPIRQFRKSRKRQQKSPKPPKPFPPLLLQAKRFENRVAFLVRLPKPASKKHSQELRMVYFSSWDQPRKTE